MLRSSVLRQKHAIRTVPFPPPSAQDSYWLGGMDLSSVNTETLPEAVMDTVIVGGGLAGMSTAHHLKRRMPGHRIAVLEARGSVAAGATGRNGGLLWPNIKFNVSKCASRHGNDEARRIFNFDHATVKAVVAFCETTAKTNPELDPLCTRFVDKGFQGITSEEETKAIANDFTWLDKQKMEPQTSIASRETVLNSIPVSGFNVNEWGALQDEQAHMVHPVKLVFAIAKQVCSGDNPAVFVPNCTVQVVTRPSMSSDNHFVLQTSKGTIRTKSIVYATNAWTSALLPSVPIVPVRNQVIVSEPVPISSSNGWGLSTNDGYEYMSQRPDGRIVLGGMRYLADNMDVGSANDSQTALNSTVSKALRQYLEKALKTTPKTDREWAGIMGWTADGNPFVGELDGFGECESGEYIIAGFTGHGMSRCFLAADAVAQLVAQDQPLPDSFPHSFLVSKERFELSIEDLGLSSPPVTHRF
ncbi:hypothetical protein HDU81_000855 [Chytriomyces hyalinus]|nr:hypothetical protein HDU81_000855 [Chytriomyces hyalinus]